MNTTYIFLTPILILSINFLLNEKNLFQSLTGDNHQKFVEKKKYTFKWGHHHYFP